MNINPYIFYIDGMEIPVTPSKNNNKVDGQNDVYSLVNGESYTALRKAKLQKYNFSFYAFSEEHPQIATYTPQEEIIKKLETLKKDKKVFEFVILRNTSDPSLRNSNCKHMTLEDYAIHEDTRYGTNILIDVSLQEYQPLKTVKLEETGTQNRDIKQVYKNVVKPIINAKAPTSVKVVANVIVEPILKARNVINSKYGNGRFLEKLNRGKRDERN